MSGNEHSEKYRHMQWHEKGAKAEVHEYERHIRDDRKGGVNGIFQSFGMNYSFPKDNKTDSSKDFNVRDTVTGNRGGRSRQSIGKPSTLYNKTKETSKYKKQTADEEHKYEGNRGDRSRQSIGKPSTLYDKTKEPSKYEKQTADKKHKYVLPINSSNNGLKEYSGVIADANTGEQQFVRGFTSGPYCRITGNNPEEMRKFANLLQNL